MTASKMIPLTVVGESPPLTRVVPKLAKKIKVGLVQFNTSFSEQYYFPLAVGMLQSYAQKHLAHPEDFEFRPMIYKFPETIEETSEKLSDCDMAIFSSYVWSEQHSLAVARDYKRRKPNGIVIFGGPQVPDSKKQFRRVRTTELNPEELHRKRMNFTPDFHRAYPFIDVAVHGEGERIFKMILEQIAIDNRRDKSQIPSASYLDNNGVFRFNAKLERMKNHELADTPSPFTTGVFDALMNANLDQKWILMYETDRGCPYQCSYCDWGGATEDRISRFPMEQIYADIMWAGERHIPYAFLCNANFGILERDVQIAEFFAESKAKFGYPEGVSTQNAKNPKKHTIEALKVLEKAGLNKATVMSQQSLNPATLKAVRRDNMKLDEYYAMQRQLAAEGVYTMTDIILPMPEETNQSIVDGISALITNGQHNRIQFNNLSILRNTEMGDPEYQERYNMKIVRTKIINGHGKKNASVSGIDEYQELVVGTNTMPEPDWIKTRVLCWMINLIYFNKLLQIPIITLHEVYGIPYGRIFESFVLNPRLSHNLPVFSGILNFFEKTACDMQNGTQEEFIHSPEWLDIWWPPEEYIFIKLCVEGKLEQFYKESEMIIMGFMKSDKSISPILDAVKLNKSLIKIPFQTEDLEILLSCNVWDIYRQVLLGQTYEFKLGTYQYTIDRTTETWNSWNEWCEKMVWWCNRRGAYLYGNKNPHQEIAGHH